MRFFIYFLITSLFLSTEASALLFSGTLIKSEMGTYKLRDERLNQVFDLTFATDKEAGIVTKLNTNDYISFDGAPHAVLASIRIDSVNFVGLYDLIDTWKGDDNYCYAFKSFTEFVVYPTLKSHCRKNPEYKREYAYTINPTDSNWLVLLSDNRTNYIADLTLVSKKSMEMSLYDSTTGYILRSIKLRK